MRVSGKGALVGAGIGAVARAAVVSFNLGLEIPLVFMLPSAAIGLLVGAIAGALGRPWIGALVGAILSGVIFELFMLPCASMIGTFAGDDQAKSVFLRSTVAYALQMAAAGALAGGIGGLVGQEKDSPPLPGPAEKPKID